MIRSLRLKFLSVLTVLLAFGFSSWAQSSIDTYYQNATGKTGNELKTSLHTIIRPHTELPYTSSDFDVWDALDAADEDPNNPDNVILIYTGRSDAKTHHDTGSGDQDAWNREHIWAKSHGNFGTTPGAGTDIHHLRACDRSVNTDRSNLFYDNGGTPNSEATECKSDSDSWEPRDAVKGDIARMIFYMAVCYEGDNGDPDLELTNDMSYSKDKYTEPYFGKLSTLLQWNEQDPVDDTERARNEKVYTIQNNRNPFIDHPEWVNEIWTGDAVDVTSPTVTEFSPANGADGVSLTANLVLTFSEEVKEGTGNITIKRDADDTVFESYDVSNVRVNFSNNTVLINPEAKFEEGTKYYAIVDQGAIIDAASNVYEGIADKTTWSFTTTYIPPALVSFSPEDDSDNVSLDTDLEITFDKEVIAGNGSILVFNGDNKVMEILASDASVTYNSEQVTIDLPNDLETATEYNIQIDNNAFVSDMGAAFEGISDATTWSFTTENPTGIEDLYAEGIPSFYPNPATTEIHLTDMSEVESLHISNLTGRNIIEVKAPVSQISLSNLPRGMYFITFISKNGNKITKKLLKQ
ncbi:endonuclease [Ancylomarina longa]|uniref:T9SS C-terminal target domain-containing protein n=1 Tax=Ancylomarina longa TaxID=2487017 RepID=A0A434AVH8_9BACT|nr:endonuclease [Ancylomarina longa]RUT78376.1 T9SS C-terminal target domain-containing protein [Ancylomarina longa]